MGAIHLKLKSLRVSSSTGLCVNISSFQPLTLLVGVSGSGKSQILAYISSLFELMTGRQSPLLDDGEYELQFDLGSDHYHYLVYIKNHHPEIIRLWRNDELLDDTIELINHLPTIKFLKPINQIRKMHDLIKQFILATPKQQEEIISLFQLIFESIEDVKIKCTEKTALQLFFKEQTGDWLSIESLSDGMLKSLYYLTQLTLCEPGAIILIDEFENGLGLNCMGPLLEEMMNHDDIQLILSSHHPYIINNIPSEKWLIITREKSTICVQSAEEFGIAQTKYDAFFELMNRLDYEGGL